MWLKNRERNFQKNENKKLILIENMMKQLNKINQLYNSKNNKYKMKENKITKKKLKK